MIVVEVLTRAAVTVAICTEGGKVWVACTGSELEVLLTAGGREILKRGAARQREAAAAKKKNAKRCILTVKHVSDL